MLVFCVLFYVDAIAVFVENRVRNIINDHLFSFYDVSLVSQHIGYCFYALEFRVGHHGGCRATAATMVGLFFCSCLKNKQTY